MEVGAWLSKKPVSDLQRVAKRLPVVGAEFRLRVVGEALRAVVASALVQALVVDVGQDAAEVEVGFLGLKDQFLRYFQSILALKDFLQRLGVLDDDGSGLLLLGRRWSAAWQIDLNA